MNGEFLFHKLRKKQLQKIHKNQCGALYGALAGVAPPTI
jgi:hypothetical protein